MSYSVFDESDIKEEVPNRVTKRIKENMDKYNMCLSDAFKEAVRTYSIPGTTLYKAFMTGDYREYIPCVYREEYLDFNKYPLQY